MRVVVNVVCAGTSHHRVPVDALERAMHAARTLADAFAAAISSTSSRSWPCTELALLATCNRVEVYAAARGEVHAARDWLAKPFREAGLSEGANDAGASIYVLHGEAAARHLCRVAAGLDSMVLGEPQIAGQVARAFRAARHENGGAPVLASLALAAQRAGRRARAETGISRGPASVTAVGVRTAAEELGGLDGRRIVVVGAGKIGRLACQSLCGAVGDGARITIANRTRARAELLAARVGGEAAPLTALDDLLVSADVLLTSTSSPVPLIDAARARRVLARRDGRPLLILDVAVPRNVEAAVGALDGVCLFGLDDLRGRLGTQLEDRRAHTPAVEVIVEEEVATWTRASDAEVVHAIDTLYRAAEQARQREVATFLAEVGDADADSRARVDQMTRSIVRRLLHEPTARIRAESEPARRRAYARFALSLFGLDAATAGELPAP